jgi:hypothetical protein
VSNQVDDPDAPRPKSPGQDLAERRDIAAVLDELQAIRQVLADIRELLREQRQP